jgi:hypothetical protein
MTAEERFERIEHVTAGLAEQFRKDREENRQLWRDTQRHINELTLKVANMNDAITRLAEETRGQSISWHENRRQPINASGSASKPWCL